MRRWECELVVDAGIVDRERRRKEPIADDFVSRRLGERQERKAKPPRDHAHA